MTSYNEQGYNQFLVRDPSYSSLIPENQTLNESTGAASTQDATKITEIIRTAYEIQGKIEGDSLHIGSDGNSSFRVDNAGKIWSGHIEYASAPFRVDENGNATLNSLTASGATIDGTITSTDAILGGFYINSTTIASNITEASAGISLNSSTEEVRIGDTGGNYLLLNAPSLYMKSSNYVSGPTGSGFYISDQFAEFGDIRARGKFTTATFETEAISAISGSLLTVKSADVLDADMTALDAATMTIAGGVTFTVGDFLRIKDGVNDEWFEVTDADAAPVYTVTRDKAAAYGADSNPTWKKGVSVVDYGVSGDGGILLTASEVDSPRLDVFTHAGAPWTTLTTRLRVGNLNGYLGLTDNVFGFGVGDTSDYLRVYHDGTNLQFRLALTSANSKAEVEVGSDGYLEGGQTTYNTGDGWWFGNTGGSYKASIGDGTQYLLYDNGELSYKGALEAVYPIQLKTYATADLPDPIVDTGYNAGGTFA